MLQLSDDDPVLQMTVRSLLERSARLIFENSPEFSDLNRRIDLNYDVDVEDPRLSAMHRLRVRVRITAKGLMHEDTTERETQ